MKAFEWLEKQAAASSSASLRVMNSAMFYTRTAQKGWVEMSIMGAAPPLILIATSPLECSLLTYEDGCLTEVAYQDECAYKEMLAHLCLHLRSDPSVHPEDLRVFSREVARIMDYKSRDYVDEICGYTKKKSRYTNKAA